MPSNALFLLVFAFSFFTFLRSIFQHRCCPSLRAEMAHKATLHRQQLNNLPWCIPTKWHNTCRVFHYQLVWEKWGAELSRHYDLLKSLVLSEEVVAKTFLIFGFYLCRPRCRRYTFISNNDISTQATSDRSILLLQQVAREVPSKQAKSEAINAEEQRHEKRHIFLSCHCSISRGVLSLDSVHTFSSQNGGAADRNLASKKFRLHWNGG